MNTQRINVKSNYKNILNRKGYLLINYLSPEETFNNNLNSDHTWIEITGFRCAKGKEISDKKVLRFISKAESNLAKGAKLYSICTKTADQAKSAVRGTFLPPSYTAKSSLGTLGL